MVFPEASANGRDVMHRVSTPSQNLSLCTKIEKPGQSRLSGRSGLTPHGSSVALPDFGSPYSRFVRRGIHLRISYEIGAAVHFVQAFVSVAPRPPKVA